MKYLTFVFIFAVLFLFNVKAQNNTICAVKYKDLKSSTILGTHNYWFYQDKLVSVKEPNNRAIHMRGFPVLINGVMTTQTDTIKFNREFNEYIDDMNDEMKKKPVRVTMKYYNSDISKMTYFYDYKNKNYIVVDTLQNMDSWEILNDTMTFMGFKCQKASIKYKQDTYTAWFTTQLPYNAGPDGFRGLPGLILKVNNSSGKLGFEAIVIQTPFKGVVPTFSNEGEIISQNDWLILSRERNSKLRESMNNMMNEYKKDLKQKQ